MSSWDYENVSFFSYKKFLRFSVDDVHKMIKSCQICNECKPCFYNAEPNKLTKATQLMEQLNVDFKRPLPSNSNNKHILTFVDKYYRFLFAIPCQDVNAVSLYKA